MFWQKKPVEGHDPDLIEALRAVRDADRDRDIVTLGWVGAARRQGRAAEIVLDLPAPVPAEPWAERVRAALPDIADLSVRVRFRPTFGRYAGGARGQEPDGMAQVAHILLVASGKGGVGKSTVATNLAVALARLGARVGLLDADIHGPSIPTMFGTMEDVTSVDGKTIDPIERFGLKLMSMGFFLPPDKAMIWRGPMVHGAVVQFLRDVHWGPLDYLVVDLPPGTGDVQLTFSQEVKVTGAVVVSTPQEVALADVIRAKTMFDTVGIPTLGVVENMAWFTCPSCDARHYPFAREGARELARRLQLPFLGDLPLDGAVREGGDRGIPVTEAEPDGPMGRAFVELARKVADRAALVGWQGEQAAAASGPSPAARRSLPVL